MAELISKLEAMQTQLNELTHEKEVLKQTLVARKGAAARRVIDLLTSLRTFSPQALRHAQQACVDEVPAAVPQVSAPPPKPGPQLMGQADQRAPWCSIGPPLAEDMLTIESEYFKAYDGLGRAVKWSRRTLFRRDSGALTPLDTTTLFSPLPTRTRSRHTHTHSTRTHAHT